MTDAIWIIAVIILYTAIAWKVALFVGAFIRFGTSEDEKEERKNDHDA